MYNVVQKNSAYCCCLQVVVLAIAVTLLFKSDKDVSEFESDLGKLKETEHIRPLNTGTLKNSCSSTLLHFTLTTSSCNLTYLMYMYVM